MDQPVNSVLNLDKSAEVREIPDASMHACADLITLMQRLPGIFLHLFHAETDATRPWIDAQHFNLNHVSRINHLARMFDSFGPAHLGDMNESFNAALELDKRAVISDARNLTIHARADRETLFDAGPWIGK